MRKYPIHEHRVKHKIHYASLEEVSYLSWHWRVMQNLKKNWLAVWKMTWGIWQNFNRALKNVKIGTLMESFCPSFTFTEELYVMTMKNDTKIEEKLTCRFKIDMRNLTNFHPSTWKSKKSCFNGLFVTKIYNVWAKKVQRSYPSSHWRVM